MARTYQIDSSTIDYCTEFDTVSDNCTECIEGYHLESLTYNALPYNRCVINTDFCLVYDVTDSECDICEIGYSMIVDTGARTCVEDSTLIEAEADTPVFYPGYIEECVENSQCSDIVVSSVPANLTQFYSCHVCEQDDHIPFVSLRTQDTSIEGIQRYSKPLNVTDRQDLAPSFYSSTCLLVNAETFGISDSDFDFPENCALGVINSNSEPVAQTTSYVVDASQLGVYCSACKPGYKALPSQLYDDFLHIYDCEAITHCSIQGTNFNECE